MNVMCVCSTVNPVLGGGTGERTVQLLNSLVGQGVNCSLVTLKLGDIRCREVELQGVDIYPVHYLFNRLRIPQLDRSRLKEMLRNIDAVHLMSHWTLLNAMIYREAQKLGIPYVHCPAGSLKIFGRSKSLKHLYNMLIGKSLVKDADALISVSRDEVSDMLACGAKPSRIVHIPNGINEACDAGQGLAEWKKKHGIRDRFLLFLGRLNPIKGPDILLEAFSKIADDHKDLSLVFGNPPGGLEAELKERTVRLGLSNKVHFTGFLRGHEKAAALKNAEFLVIPSRREAMSIVVLEAGVAGTPVLATNQCGLAEFESNGVRLVPPESQPLAAELSHMLQGKADLRSEMGSKLQQIVAKNYTWEVIGKKYLDLLQNVVKSKPVERHVN